MPFIYQEVPDLREIERRRGSVINSFIAINVR
jgi:hypothetical protein